MNDQLLVVESMIKRYGKFLALNDFECEIPVGVTGLLGPNGAGKTTFIRCLLGIIPFEGGNIRFLDYEIPGDHLKIKDMIGYQSELETKMHRTSAQRYVTHFGRMAGLPREAALQRAFDTLHYVGLEEARYRDMHTFSAGMLQRVKLATALVQDPLLIVLDEPTAGMDPQGRDQMLKLIHDLGHNQGKHILLCTHLLPDVEKTSNYVVVISHGQRITQGLLKQILERKSDQIPLVIRVGGNAKLFAEILRENNFEAEKDQDHITCHVDRNDDSTYLKIFKLAKKNGMDVRMMSPYRQTLEDVFLDLVVNNNSKLGE
ncbi:MAG: ABC transporter ATP-binding protein [Candidatus Hodarchaeota archaeon]